MAGSDSEVTRWFGQVREGNADSLRNLWNCYFLRLAKLAGGRLASAGSAEIDGEDVASSVFQSLWNGAQLGRFDGVQDRHELWWLLVRMTKRKVVDQIRRGAAARRGGGVPHASLPSAESGEEWSQTLSLSPSPEEVAILSEEMRRLLSILRDRKSRQIAVLLLEGCSTEEISRRMGLAASTIRRKARLIRAYWQQELGS